MTFVLNSIKWTVIFLNPSNRKLRRSDGSYTVGMTEIRTRTVYIANNLHPAFEWKVLCHEIVHAAMASYGIFLTIEQEEIIADIIATYGKEIIQTTDRVFSRLRGLAA